MAYGRLYVFEGADGVGKSTLAQQLAQHLRDSGHKAQVISFPGKEPGSLGALVYALHHEHRKLGVTDLHPASLQILHVAAHVDAIEKQIVPLLQQGVTVILDRYWWSTWVYGIVSRVKRVALESMIQAERYYWGKVRPNAVFLCERYESLRPQERSDDWLRITAEYRKLARREASGYPTVIIKNDLASDAALTTVLDVVVQGQTDKQSRQSQSTPSGLSPCEANQGFVPSTPTIFSRLSPIEPTAVYDTYWRFAAERQAVFFRRLEKRDPPFSDDPILQRHKFTNAYRASDRVSQFLIRHVIYEGDQAPDEVFFRTLLFKFFNKIDTWLLLQERLGTISYREFDFSRYDEVLTNALERGRRIYSAAYIMPSGGPRGETKKHRTHLKLLARMMDDGLAARIADARTMKAAFELLKSYPTIGDFLAYQYVTDLNYSTLINFSESEFVIPGPGARDGIRKCFRTLGGLNEADTIRLVTERQEREFERLGLKFQSLWGRPLQLIDCQNLFCEVDKYARVAHPEVKGLTGRTRIKQTFTPNPAPIQYWYPPKWSINDRIRGGADVPGRG